MGRYKILYQNTAWLGGWRYRATTNGLLVHLQEIHLDRVTWRTVRRITMTEWKAWADSMDLDNQYNDNLVAFQAFVLGK